jgi:2-polyprenyl-6-methoxyphenol hydroxylase-like FAD-dependent oxidoreductase
MHSRGTASVGASSGFEEFAMTASFAIIGAGIGGVALTALLSRRGARVKLYEQATSRVRNAGLRSMRQECET